MRTPTALKTVRQLVIQKRLEEAGLTRKIGNNQVQAICINVSGTHEDMERIEREGVGRVVCRI
ncbi:hypothetical protein M125_5865 [Bacteroides fragilis str. 3998T(B)3]|uniref:Uncharacterized protein n=1 Tax=Bacteroides fragilis str. 3998T(B)3 TaxID=1339316 RepID=A0A015UWX0_BACFG|nr:hypothetical protein M125_5865 [Bacteroides fragilis str. 3998T(B)3]EXY98344.1 hypothetical protein M081_4673 [Bacteroides fragilis str. 3998 T(B) 4]